MMRRIEVASVLCGGCALLASMWSKTGQCSVYMGALMLLSVLFSNSMAFAFESWKL